MHVTGIQVPYKYKNIINNLHNNNSIVILKQDKGRGVIIMNKTTYMEKRLSMLSTDQFKKLNKDPTTTTEREVQTLLRSIKSKLPTHLYSKLYPTGSQPAKFYGTQIIN